MLTLLLDAVQLAVGLSVLGLLWAPALFVLRLPIWIAPALAFAATSQTLGSSVVLAMPLAAMICTYAARLLFARAWLLQLLVVLFMLDAAALYLLGHVAFAGAPLAVSAGFAIGITQARSLQGSINRFAFSSVFVLIAIICIHPGLWGASVYRPFVDHYLEPFFYLSLLGIGSQMGAGVYRRIREQDFRRDARIASREIDALMVRLGREAVPA